MCRYSSVVVNEVKQVLLAHTDAGIRGDRQITFDQWAQLFEWISSRLDVSTPEKLHRRMGSYIGFNLDDAGRAPLQVLFVHLIQKFQQRPEQISVRCQTGCHNW